MPAGPSSPRSDHPDAPPAAPTAELGYRVRVAGARTVFAAGRQHCPMNRRELLAAVGGLGGAVVAGCLGGEGGHDQDDHTHTPTDSEPAESAAPDDWRDRVSFGDVDRAVYVEAEKYRFTPGTAEPIRVGLDERVGIAATALDEGYHSGHGLYVPADAYDVDLQATPGGADSTTFLADEAGEFELRCDVYCGEGHDEMTGRLVVE